MSILNLDNTMSIPVVNHRQGEVQTWPLHRTHRKPAGPPVLATSSVGFGDTPVVEWSYSKRDLVLLAFAIATGIIAIGSLITAGVVL